MAKKPRKKAKQELSSDSQAASKPLVDENHSASSFPPGLLRQNYKRNHTKKKPTVEAILPGCVWVVHDFLQADECQAWVDFAEKSRKLEYTAHPASKYVANRECFRLQRNDTAMAERIFVRMQNCGLVSELQQHVQFPSSSYLPRACNSNIRLYKYEKGMAFGKHVDGSNIVKGVGQTEVTVLVYLSSCQGGATRFYPASGKKKESVPFIPQVGAILVHVHGDRCLEHEADPVENGVKYILRTDLVYSEG